MLCVFFLTHTSNINKVKARWRGCKIQKRTFFYLRSNANSKKKGKCDELLLPFMFQWQGKKYVYIIGFKHGVSFIFSKLENMVCIIDADNIKWKCTCLCVYGDTNFFVAWGSIIFICFVFMMYYIIIWDISQDILWHEVIFLRGFIFFFLNTNAEVF